MARSPGLPKAKKPLPFAFVLDELDEAEPRTRPMFGGFSVYVGEKIVLILYDKPEAHPEDSGVWLATTGEHHESLARDLPSMRSIKIFGPGPTGWQVLPKSAPDFEEAVAKACRLILRGDPRIGKIPKPRRKASGAGKKPSAKKLPRPAAGGEPKLPRPARGRSR